MRKSDVKSYLNADAYQKIGESIIDLIEEYGFGTLSKSTFDAFIFEQIKENVKPGSVKNSFDWINILRVTPAQLKTLQLNASIKFSSETLDMGAGNPTWHTLIEALAGVRIEVEDAAKGTVRFYLEEPHLQRFIEKFALDHGSSTDYTMNRNQVVMKYDIYQQLVEQIYTISGYKEKELVIQLKKDLAAKEITKDVSSLKATLESIKEEFKDTAKEELAKKTFEVVSESVFKFLKNKLFGK